ncbi:MAG: cysteine dioxygenase family protein [Hyphomicrobiaceae bacterium]|nr:cysteine dioxygenase family protein [Hyphomicrobiaceae bacterium]
MAQDAYTLEQYVTDIRAIVREETDEDRVTSRIAPLAKRLAAAPGWLKPGHRKCDEKQGFGVHLLHEEPNHDLAVFLIAWLPNRGTMPHNHKTWAVVAGIEGLEQEVEWHRRDDGARTGYADLERVGESVMTAGDVTTCRSDDIHSVWNVGSEISMSLHTYGRHINFTGRSEFDPERKAERPMVVTVEDKQ